MKLSNVTETKKAGTETNSETTFFPHLFYFEGCTGTLCVATDCPVDWWEEMKQWSFLYSGRCGQCGTVWPIFTESKSDVRLHDEWICPDCSSSQVVIKREEATDIFSPASE